MLDKTFHSLYLITILQYLLAVLFLKYEEANHYNQTVLGPNTILKQ